MNEKDIEEKLKKIGRQIEIDQEHKAELRRAFEGKRTAASKYYKKYLAAACIVLLAITVAYSLLFAPIYKVQAEALRVQNYRTYLEVENTQNLSVAEYNGALYIPDVQQGIYRFDGKEKQQIYSGKVSMIKVSPTGTKLLFFEDGNIGMLDVNTLESRLLLESDGNIMYESPAWLNENTILFNKLVLQESASAVIYKLNLANLEQIKLVEGTNPSYISNTNSLLYQRGENIVVRNLRENTEMVIDQGMQPTVSPDGKAITYTRLDIAYENISKNVLIEKVLQNIWVADGRNYERKTMITSNIVLEDIDREEWLKNIKPSDEVQMLSFSGRYGYQFPTWSSDSKAVYALRRDYPAGNAVVVKIELGKDALSAKAVTERFLQSIILKDEDYQSSLISVEMNAIEKIKRQNLMSFQVIKVGKDDAMDYVDVEISITEEGTELTNTSQVRFYLSNQTGQFYIVDMEEL